MSITTYAELKTAVANWLNRTDLTSKIPDFITIAESQLASDLRIREMEKRVTASISTEYFDIPTDFIEMRNIQLNTSPITRLNYYSPEQMDTFEPYTSSGKPLFYTIHGTEFQLKPIPDQSYTIEMTYFYRPTAFSADNDTNTILTRYPDIYLYASCLAAQPYLADDKRIALWLTAYQTRIAILNESDKHGRFSGSTLRTRSDIGVE